MRDKYKVVAYFMLYYALLQKSLQKQGMFGVKPFFKGLCKIV